MFSITERSKEATNCLPSCSDVPRVTTRFVFVRFICRSIFFPFSTCQSNFVSLFFFPRYSVEIRKTRISQKIKRCTTVVENMKQLTIIVSSFTNNACALTDKGVRYGFFTFPSISFSLSLSLFHSPRTRDRELKCRPTIRRGVDRFFQSWRPEDLDKTRALSCASSSTSSARVSRELHARMPRRSAARARSALHLLLRNDHRMWSANV